MQKASEAIDLFLLGAKNTHNSDLIERVRAHGTNLELQINVSPKGGELVDGTTSTYTDGLDRWHSFRIPKGSFADPHWQDFNLRFPIEKHVDAIGSTGWRWASGESLWVAYDIDAITGHAAGVGLPESELIRVRDAVSALDYVETRKSTSGNGLHLYVLLPPGIKTANHGEHAAVARAVLSRISQDVGFDMGSSIDVCGSNTWIWARRANVENEGFKLIKAASCTFPHDLSGWQRHLTGTRMPRSRTVGTASDDIFEQITSGQTPLDAKHKAVINGLMGLKGTTIWNQVEHLLHSHTVLLKQLHEGGNIRGNFDTISPGTKLALPNCFLHPMADGAFRVTRFGPGTPEHASWKQDSKVWTSTTYNKEETTPTVENITEEVAEDLSSETIRKVHSEDGESLGFFVETSTGTFVNKSEGAVTNIMKFRGMTGIPKKLGKLETEHWTKVTRPLLPEYPEPGQRIWNRDRVQFRVEPKEGPHPTWSMIYAHLGIGLDTPLKEANIEHLPDGQTFLKAWIALALRMPTVRLPFISFVGEENCGKTKYLESLNHIITSGIREIDKAITSDFSGELDGCLFGAIEEVAILKKHLPRLRGWITSKTLEVHAKGRTPYPIDNTLHLVQTTNKLSFIPVVANCTRFIALKVAPLPKIIAAGEFDKRLAEEAPAMLHTFMNMPLPVVTDRLALLPIKTALKASLQSLSMSELDRFFDDCVSKSKSETPMKLKDFEEVVLKHLREYTSRNEIEAAILSKGGHVKLGRSRYRYVHGLKINEPEEIKSCDKD